MVRYRVPSFLLLLTSALSGCIDEGDPTAAVFDRTKLHEVEITVDEPYLDELATDLENRVPCTVVYDGERIEGAGIRQKGNSLVDLSDKPSFSVKLDAFDEDADLHGLNKLLLNSSAQDPTFLRERLGADLYARAGLPTARVAHAVVTLNGVDKGVYVVVEAIDKDFLRRRFGEANGEGNLYEGPCCGDFVDDIDHMELEDEKKEGRSRDDLIALAQVIQDAPDAELAAKVDERLDFGGFITSYALDALIDHWDGYAYRGNNYYVYNNPADGRFVFIPHGMDRILEDPHFDPETTPVTRLPQRIREIPALDEQLHAEIGRLVTTAWDENALLGAIDQAEGVLRTASAGEQTSRDIADFDANVSGLRETVKLRGTLVDPAIHCGDGLVEGLETCDDGNASSGDGCSARCRIEP
ncbi:CotH kinase family protein [Polyangium aurulentum]|uniref:CotH kinase family protein n=1 Tax=Polyangium aurulentum TaxID=2567896 RepID=UPI0010AE40E5|nr:CotH kinase family protein [Polyangium aurulentum]UQA63157.1 CotH kinase family protein [Polyangium aurulentum]